MSETEKSAGVSHLTPQLGLGDPSSLKRPLESSAPPSKRASTESITSGSQSNHKSAASADTPESIGKHWDEFADCTLAGDLLPLLCGKELPLDAQTQRNLLRVMYLEIIVLRSIEKGPYMNWYFTARQSMSRRGLEKVYLEDDQSDPELYIEARKHHYALVHSADEALLKQLWPSVPILQITPHSFFKLMQSALNSRISATDRLPAVIAFQQLERGPREPMKAFLQRAVTLYFTMAYLPLELWFQLPLAMLSTQIMLAHRKHYTFGCFMTQASVDEETIKWTSGKHLPALLGYFKDKADVFNIRG